jgi:uncharacterized membrane protein
MSTRYAGLMLIAAGVLLLIMLAVGPSGGTWGWTNAGWNAPHIWGLSRGGWLLGIAAAIGVAWLAVTVGGSHDAAQHEVQHSSTSAAVEHLKWRYAAGEITREQYGEMLRVLDSRRT